MAKQPKAKAEDQAPELKRYKAPKHAVDVHLPSGVKKIRGGVVTLPADAIAEHELLIRAGFKPVTSGEASPETLVEADAEDEANRDAQFDEPPAE